MKVSSGREEITIVTYMEVLAVRENGDVTDYGEAHNSWGGAMHIWMKLAQEYDIPFGFSEEGFKKIWSGIVRMNESDQWVMASTFDMMIVLREDVPTLIKHWKAFCERYPSDTLSEGIAILERAAQDQQVQAICFNHTSIVDSWSVPSEEEQGESRPYNIHLDQKHKWLNADYIRQCV